MSSEDWWKKNVNTIYNLICVVTLILMAIAGFQGKLGLSTLLFLLTIAFLVMANFKDIKLAKASKDGIEIHAKEILQKAEVTITELQELAKLVAKVSLSLIKRSGRLGGYPENEQEEIKTSILDLLEKLNISDEEKKYILHDYNRFIEIDYVFLILGNHVPSGWSKEDVHAWQSMRNDLLSQTPPPEKIRDLLERNASLTDLHRELIEDYEYFRINKKYRRPDMISEHQRWRNEIKLIVK